MRGFACPLDGCDYGRDEPKNEAQVRGHMGANIDHPNPSEFQGDLPRTDHEIEGEEDTQEDDDSSAEEPGENQHEDEQDMATDQEYQDQQNLLDRTDEDQDDQDADADQDGDGFGLTIPRLDSFEMNDTVLMMLVIVGVLVFLAYLVHTGDETETIDVNQDHDDQDAGGEPAGGLV